ncbi:caspase domain-containing protein [Armillaria borealis]|uniref:Caspase domain-containing protein n=1 Tax=Armillaria borealis TaxID=47425 RepID=A0AA39K0C6_9AGAR|nr:caspase domain-containing protein [Armillaria borealis]
MGTRGKEAAKETNNIFALIIGIDKYERDEYRLEGAVSDANAFKHYVSTDLGAPEDNIISLRDKEATRSQIIDAFKKLKDREDIVPGKAIIIIYYAGHGAVAKKPAQWEDWDAFDNNIEMLCPVDMTFRNSVKEKTEGIPDRTISCLLLDLSAAKGNNIVLILDCCHSAGIDRGAIVRPGPDAKAREIGDEEITISAQCDSSIYSGRTSGFRKSSQSTNTTNFSGSLWDSHILLAACGRNQKAWETQKKGIFTRALLQAVRETPGAYLTYRSLMLRFDKMPSYQSPQLDGNNIHQRLFYPSQEPVNTSMILCRREDAQPYLILEAGQALGITKGSIYQLYRTDLPESESLGTAVVKEVETECTSHLWPHDSEFFVTHKDIPNIWYARLVKTSRRSLLIYCDDLHSSFLEKVISGNPTQLTVPVARTNDRQEADLCLEVKGDIVLFDRGGRNSYFNGDKASFEPMKDNRLFRSMESPRISAVNSTVHDIAQTQRIINHYANFTYHLTVQSPYAIDIFDAAVTMHELRRPTPRGTLRPIVGSEDALRFDNGKLVRIDVDMSLPIEKRPRYGLTLKNNGDLDLYACLFYFDASTLDIENWFHSKPSLTDDMGKQNVDPCISARSTLTFGFGNTATRPIAFDVPEGQDVDICCFKIFVSLKPLDLRSISQILKMSRGAALVSADPPQLPDPDESWASLVIPVIQQRLNKSHK